MSAEVERVAGFQLSPQQLRLWSLLDGRAEAAYGARCAVLIEGPLAGGHLKAALDDLVRRFEILRTSFRRLPEMDVPLQFIEDAAEPRLALRAVEGMLGGSADGESEELFAQLIAGGEPEAAAALAFSLYPLGERRHVLTIALSALCCDRLGLHNLVRELERSYAAGGTLVTGATADRELQLADLAQWQHEVLASADPQMGGEHFRLAGRRAGYRVPLPRRAGDEPFRPAAIEVGLEPALAARLAEVAGGESISLEALLLAAWMALLGRLDEDRPPLVGVSLDGRNYAELEDAIGPFEKYLPASGDWIEAGGSLSAAARRTASGLDDLRRWQECFAWERSLETAASREPFFYSAAFELFDRERCRGAFGDRLQFTVVADRCCSERFEVKLAVRLAGSRIDLELLYDAARFAVADVDSLGERLTALLGSFAARPELAIEDLTIVPADERRRLLEIWSGEAARAHASLGSMNRSGILARFSEAACREPDRLALACEGERATYRELDAFAHRIARRLRRSGVGPEVAVGLCAERSPALVASILGIWRAGGAYVPLDPAIPAGRRRLMIEDGGVARVLATGAAAADLAGEGIEVIDPEGEEVAGESSSPLADAAAPANLAYVIFTSGSTGRPKGVAIEHRQLAAYVDGVLERLALPEGASFASVTTFAADLGHTAIFPALATGGCLHLVSPERAADPNAFRQYAAAQEIDCLKIVPGHLAALLEGGQSELVLPRRALVLGGEAARWELVDRVRSLAPECAILNHYGPTEATVGALTYTVPMEEALRPAAATVPLGRPLATATVYLLDRRGEPVPAGLPGEVYLGGEGVARGYHGRPELTAAAFLPHPWGSAGARLYRTGDLAGFLPDGGVQFLGRVDRQVKIRGYRIEPEEIAAVLARHPAVRACAVAAPAVDGGERRLVAYVVEEEPGVPASSLRAYLETLLPPPMIPAVFVALDRLPRTANGKVDLAALPAPRDLALDPAAERGPRTPTEERLAAVWRELLDLERVGAERSFFDLGGHSLLAMRLVSRVSDTFGVDVPLRSFVEAPTIAGLAAAIDGAEREAGGPALPTLVADVPSRHLPFPLTDVQQAYWIGRSSSFELGNVSTHAYFEFDLPALDAGRLDAALGRIVERHEMLRTVFLPTGEQQILAAVPHYEIAFLDLRGMAPEAAAAGLEEVRARMSHQVFPTDRWPLFELRVSRLAGDRFRLHVSSDALVRDAWSFRLLSEDLAAAYLDPEHRFEPLEISFRDYVLAEVAFAGSAAYARSLEHWRARLADLPPAPQLPLAMSPGSLVQPRFVARRGGLDAAAWSRLKQRGSAAGLSPTGLLLAAFTEVLATWSKSPRFTVNLTLFNRLPVHPQVDRVVGDFTSLLLVGIDAAGRGTFAERARRVQTRLWEDLDHRHVSGIKVLRDLMRRDSTAGQAVMPVVFTSLLGFAEPAKEVAEPLAAELVYTINQTSQVWLDHQVLEDRGALIYHWASVEGLFPPRLLDDMIGAFGRLLAMLAADETEGGGEAWARPVPCLVPAEQLARRAAVNATGEPVSPALLHGLFLAEAARAPQRTAVVSPLRSLTYSELERWSRHLALRLHEMGARPNRLVAVVMEKGWEQVAAVLGVLRAGAAYLPIDADLPRARQLLLLERGQVEIALVQPAVEARIDWPAGVARLAVGGDPPLDPLELDPGWEPATTDLAYVIFTSGSSGEPKGVMIDHRGAVNTVLDINRRFRVGPDDRVLALSALNFDLSVYDVFGLLAAGGAVVLPEPAASRDPGAWTRLAAEAGVTLWDTVPALMEMWVEHLEAHPGPEVPLRFVLLSGDWIPVTLPDRIRALFPRAEVVGAGGATEASIWSIHYPIGAVDPSWRSIPYGRPLANQTFHVLGESLAPKPEWVTGELAIGGIGVALGYWRDPERTAASFVEVSAERMDLIGAERLYLTGDLGRYLPSGDIEFLGREDLQVKVQGHRIELGEIEAALGAHPAVQSCVVAARGAHSGGARRLVGYVVPRGAAPSPDELRDLLRSRLPAYMVPAAWVFLEALPLSTNGKVDRAALPEPAAAAAPAASATPSAIALRIAELVARALKVERVDPNASLLEIGASSIDMVRIANLLEDEFGFRPRMNDLFQFSIVGAVSAYYETLLARGEVYQKPAGEAVADGGRWSLAPLLRDPDERDRFKKLQLGRRRDVASRPRVALADGPLTAAELAAFVDRRSHRRFASRPLPKADLAALLAGLRQVSENGAPKHRYGSAGGLYPVQTYLYLKPDRVLGMAAGTYYHDPVEHSLVRLSEEARIDGGVYGWISQPIFDAAAFALYLVGDAGAIAPMYGERSRDFSLLEAGLMAQLLESCAPSLDIGLCQIGGADFDRVRPFLALGEGHELLHSLVGGALERELEADRRRTAEVAAWEEGTI
jgi:amino acid adenylation domain-containing protein